MEQHSALSQYSTQGSTQSRRKFAWARFPPCGHITVTQQEAGLPRAQVSHRKGLWEVLPRQQRHAHWACGRLPTLRCLLTRRQAGLWAALRQFLRPVLTLAVTSAVVPVPEGLPWGSPSKQAR